MSPKDEANMAACTFLRQNGLKRLRCECNRASNVHMHHPDYSRPLVVAFLCPKCHVAEHRGALQRAYRIYDLREMAKERAFAPAIGAAA